MQYGDVAVTDHSGDDYFLCGRCGTYTPLFYVVRPAGDPPTDGFGACSGCVRRVINQFSR